MLKYLYDQLELGFNPKYLITYHLKHPRDYLRPMKETNKKYGHRDRIGFRGCGDLWKKVGYDKYMTQMRNDYDFTVKDNRYVQKLIFKWLYGISKIKKDTVLPRMMYFIEKGGVEIVTGNGKPIARLIAGDCFGEAALIKERARNFSARAVRPTRLVLIEREVVKKELEREHALVRLAVILLLKRLDLTNKLNLIQTES